jgi:hypothetical protein
MADQPARRPDGSFVSSASVQLDVRARVGSGEPIVLCSGEITGATAPEVSRQMAEVLRDLGTALEDQASEQPDG